MKILLVNPPARFLLMDGDRLHLGLLYVGTFLTHLGHEVSVCDLAIGDDLMNNIKCFSPDLIGFTSTTSQFSYVCGLVKKIREHNKKIRLIIGGSHATVCPEQCLELFDQAVRGESEFVLETILSNPHFLLTCGEAVNNLDSLPIPDRNLVDMSKYNYSLFGERAATLISSRGCVYNCTYCSNIHERKYRAHSPDRVLEEMFYLAREYNFKNFYFYDDVFTLDKKRTLELCDLLKPLGFKFRCTTRIDCVDEEILLALKKAGCGLISYGLESGSDRMLKIYDKRFTVEDIKKTILLTKKIGIEIKGFWIKAPFETEEDRMATENLIKELNLEYNDVYNLIAFPGSRLWDKAEEYGLEKNFDKLYYSHKPHDESRGLPCSKIRED